MARRFPTSRPVSRGQRRRVHPPAKPAMFIPRGMPIDHLVPPDRAPFRVGWPGPPGPIDREWLDQHARAERQTRGEVPEMLPTRILYNPMVARVKPGGALAAGWTIDY